MDKVQEIAGKTPGVVLGYHHCSHFPRSTSVSRLAHALAWPDPDRPQRQPARPRRGSAVVVQRALPAPADDPRSAHPAGSAAADPGIGNAAVFAMQIELRDGNADDGKLQAVTNTIVANGQTQSALQRVSSLFRSMVPHIRCLVSTGSRPRPCMSPRTRYSRLRFLIWGPPSSTSSNKFGRTFQVYTQADAQYRLTVRDIENLMVRNSPGRHGPDLHGSEDHARGRAVADLPCTTSIRC